MPDSLLFDGDDDYIRFSSGSASMGELDVFEPWTIAVAAKLTTDETAYKNFMGLNTIDSIFGTNNLSPHNLTVFVGSGGSAVSTFTIPAADGWCIYAYSNNFRFHKYVFDTDTWTHADSGGGNPEAVALTDIWFGRTGDGQSYMDANFLVAGWWNTNLTDEQIESLDGGYAAWLASGAAEIWRFNTMSTISASGSSTETTRVGTSLDVGDAPASWSDLGKQTSYFNRRVRIFR